MSAVHLTVARTALITIAIISGASCGGGKSGDMPTAPTPTTGSVPQASSALPYGQATGGAAVPCPGGIGPPAGSTCSSLVVVCPSVASAVATLRITRPASTASNRGTLVLTTGAAGANFQDSVLTPGMISTLVGDGLVVVQLAWDPPGIWGGPRARTLACRYATAAKWIYDNIHIGGKSRLFAAQGTSGGSAQIAFGLAHYGLSDLLDLANLGGGPPGCPLCSPDGQNAPEPLLPAAAPASNRDPLLAYPTTVVRFFLGSLEPTADIISDANAFHNAVTTAKSFTIVPDTAHTIEGTQTGVDAYLAAVRAALK